jgi:hypothetical protein
MRFLTTQPGVSLALNPRLMALTPPGSGRFGAKGPAVSGQAAPGAEKDRTRLRSWQPGFRLRALALLGTVSKGAVPACAWWRAERRVGARGRWQPNGRSVEWRRVGPAWWSLPGSRQRKTGLRIGGQAACPRFSTNCGRVQARFNRLKGYPEMDGVPVRLEVVGQPRKL